MDVHDYLKYKKRIIVKIGSSSLMHERTGRTDLNKIERLVRELCDLQNQGYDVCLVTSGSIAIGRRVLGIDTSPEQISTKQACAAVGQARLMTLYQRLFSEYHQQVAQILITKNTILNDSSRANAQQTFEELFRLGIIPIVNENDTVSTYEMKFGDNDTLSALVASLVSADLLILLSDIDGLYTDNPRTNPDATLIERVETITDSYLEMAKGETGSAYGTGGMATKLTAAQIATKSGADMIIVSGENPCIINQIIRGSFKGTLFLASKEPTFNLPEFMHNSLKDK